MRNWRHFDFVLLVIILALIVYGLFMINSAAPLAPGESIWDDFAVRQGLYALGGIVLLFLVAAIDYGYWGLLPRFIYLLAVSLLLIVLVLGHVRGGAQRWLFLFQPSEVTKILLVVALAKYLADRQGDAQRFRHLLISFALVAVPIGLVYAQPDLSTAMVIGVTWLGLVWMSGMRTRYLLALGLVGLALTPLLWFGLYDYMQERIRVFINPEPADLLDKAYNALQAKIAIGAGGWLGLGYQSGIQSQLRFLRVRHTDFIFSVLGEELGFAGAVLLFGFFIALFWRMLRAAALAKDAFGRLIVGGLTIMLFFQTFVNLAMNVGLLPVVGVPLPFISYGGSALMSLLIGQGLVQSVVMRHKRIEF